MVRYMTTGEMEGVCQFPFLDKPLAALKFYGVGLHSFLVCIKESVFFKVCIICMCLSVGLCICECRCPGKVLGPLQLKFQEVV